jgi:hypothetical protein
MAPNEYPPGKRAPVAGDYQELSALGTPTGKLALMTEGEPLPPAPRGFSWRLLSQRSAAELRAEAAKYRRMAASATTIVARDSLNKIADRFESLADQREREERGTR